MEQRISIVTLGVTNLARARAFYETLGWRGQEMQETVFFQAGGMAVILWSRTNLADDAGLSEPGAEGFGGITLAHNVRSREEVDEIMRSAHAAGATTLKSAQETFYGGYA